MLFPTVEYGVFFLAAFALAWALARHVTAHKVFLLAASWAFYGFWDVRFVPLLAGISLFAWGIARAVQGLRADAPQLARRLVAVGVAGALLTLAAFKYLTFASAQLLQLLHFFGVHPADHRVPELPLPVGISFFVFHAISLVVDAWRGQLARRVSLLDGLLYVAFFPQLVAGPILRARTFLPQLEAGPSRDLDAARALWLIASGLAKKMLVANFLAVHLVDPVFERPAAHAPLEVLLAVYGYAAQIYCDFSGYTSIAIGSALLLGYRMTPNFDAPYLAASPQDFWRRWHISLSNWLRDYLFIPLGGSRAGEARTLFNLLVTMVLGGLWHGAAWTFVLWGALHGLALVAHRLWSRSANAAVVRLRASAAWRPVATLLTFHLVCAGWVLFRATSLGAAGEVFGALLQPGRAAPLASLAAVLAIAVGVLGQALPPVSLEKLQARFARLPVAVQGACFAATLLVIEAFGPDGVAPFIYFQF